MADVEAEGRPEPLEGEMGLRANAAGRKCIASRMGPDEGDQFVKGCDAERRVDHDRHRRGDGNRDRREVPHRIVKASCY
jgi:hypothetical protein